MRVKRLLALLLAALLLAGAMPAHMEEALPIEPEDGYIENSEAVEPEGGDIEESEAVDPEAALSEETGVEGLFIEGTEPDEAEPVPEVEEQPAVPEAPELLPMAEPEAPDAERFPASDFVVKDGELTDYLGDETDIVIPDNLGITSIGWLFSTEWYHSLPWSHYPTKMAGKVTSVVIPEGVTSLSHTFKGCDKLRSVTLPSTLTRIDEETFLGCSKLESVDLKNVTNIQGGAFAGCSSLTRIDLSNIRILRSYAFAGCTNLSEVILPPERYRGDGISGNYPGCTLPFNDCPSLKKIVVPGGWKDFYFYDFGWNLTTLESVALSDGIVNVYSGAPLSTEGPYAGLKNLTLPGTVTAIGDGVCYGSANLTALELPDSLTSIGKEAFRGCTGLTTLTLPDNLTRIGSNSFRDCTGLKTLTLPRKRLTLDEGAFFGCTGVTELVIPGEWGRMSLILCERFPNLERVVLGEGITTLDNNVFANLSKLKEVVLPSTLTSIGLSAFRNCGSLEKLNLPQSVTSISYYAFDGCGATIEALSLPNLTSMSIGAFCNSGVKTVVNLGRVASIPNDAFNSCAKLTAVTLPASVTAINSGAFRDCPALASVTLSQGLTGVISSNAFYNCPSLKEIVIPDGVTKVATNAFSKDTALSRMVIPWSVTTLEDGFAVDCPNCVFWVYNTSYAHRWFHEHRIPYELVDPPAPTRELTLAGRNAAVQLNVGDQLQLSAKFAADAGWALTGWKSGKPKVATVDDAGMVTALAEGSATITVKTTKKSATIVVKVIDPYKPTGVALNQTGTVVVPMGGTLALGAILTPDTARTTLTWKSSSAKVAAVDGNGVVTPVKEGSATISVKTANGKSAKVKVKVVDPYKPEKVALNRTGTVVLNLGETLPLGAILTPDTARTTLTWKSSGAKVATVDGNGLVTPLKEGVATITVKTANKKAAKVKVKVVDPYKPTGVTLNLSGTVTLKVGETLQLMPTLAPASARTTLTWKTSSAKVATVDVTGKVAALKKGSATITVKTANGKSAKLKIKVL